MVTTNVGTESVEMIYVTCYMLMPCVCILQIRVPVSLILLESYLHGCPSGSPPIEDCVVRRDASLA